MTVWTEAMDGVLRERYMRIPAAEIGNFLTELSGETISKSAVIGRANRLGIKRDLEHQWTAVEIIELRRLAEGGMKRAVIAKQMGRSVNSVDYKLKSIGFTVRQYKKDALVRANEAIVGVGNFGDGGCKWPIGDPKEPDFRFCGCKEVVPGKPYCQPHCDIAYVKPRKNWSEI